MLFRPVALCHDCSYGSLERASTNTYSCVELERVHESPSHCLFYDGERFPVDVVILTAVRVEFDAVLKYLHPSGAAAWERKSTISDGIWHICTLENGKAKLRLALTQLSKVGMPAASSMAALALQLFRPSLVVMAGITAGRARKSKIGDVIVPFHIWDYGEGKWNERDKSKIFQQRIRQHHLHIDIQRQILAMGHLHKEMRAMYDDWVGPKGDSAPRILIEPMVSGAAVVNSNEVWQEVLRQDDKIIAIEMEAYGVFQAVNDASKFPYAPLCIVAKSVCDFGARKNKKVQSYAAFTSARFLQIYLSEYALALASTEAPCKTNIPWKYELKMPPVRPEA